MFYVILIFYDFDLNLFSFAIVAADATSCRSILVYKHDEDKVCSKALHVS